MPETADQLRNRQENLTWPNYVVNSRGADQILFKGVENPTLVQRIAAWLFGLTYIAIGFGFWAITLTMEQNSWVMWILAGIMWVLGSWVCYNGSRNRRKEKKGG